MCGIAGIYNLNKKKVDLLQIDNLTDSLKHRGPDGRGVWISEDKNIALGHRRLSILDLSTSGHQPMLSKENDLVIILNGEIYNFIEIREELIEIGYEFISNTDTEVILYAFKQWGLKMLDKFNGMWAFAILDIKSNKLILSRDRYGIKPLYYYYDNDIFIFASEVKSILNYLGDKATINRKVINDILKFNQSYHGTEQTHINEIKSVPAGHNIIIDNGTLNIYGWYKLKKVEVPRKFKDQADVLRELLTDAIKIRLRSDVPIGTCLSGGIDSGSISSLINTLKANNDVRFNHFTHRSFCAGFPGVEFDESNEALALSLKLNLKLDIVNIQPPTIQDLEDGIMNTDGPMASFAFFPIWKLYKYIKQEKITVSIDGQGSDEMLGGYYMGYEAMMGAWDLKNIFWFIDVYSVYSKFNRDAAKRMIKDFKYFLLTLKKRFFNSKNKQLSKPSSGAKDNFFDTTKFNNSFDNKLYDQFFVNPLPFLLHQYDRASMANSIECRMPFMDFRVVEFIFSLPPQSKVGKGYSKRVLREAVKGILPDNIRLNKKKIGFNAPTIEWFRNDLNSWFLDQINSDSFIENKYFDGKKIRDEFLNSLHSEQANDYVFKYWSYIHLNYWLKYNNIN